MKKVFAAGLALAVLMGTQGALAATPDQTPVQVSATSSDSAYSEMSLRH